MEELPALAVPLEFPRKIWYLEKMYGKMCTSHAVQIYSTNEYSLEQRFKPTWSWIRADGYTIRERGSSYPIQISRCL